MNCVDDRQDLYTQEGKHYDQLLQLTDHDNLELLESLICDHYHPKNKLSRIP